MRGRAAALTVAALCIAAALRVVGLDADPPAELAEAFLTDEGWWAHNARNHALFGRWTTDDFNQALYAAPVYTLAVRGAFALFGPGLWQARLISALAGIATVVFVTLLLRRERGAMAALAGVTILGFDFFSLSHQRVAMTETLPVAWMCLAAWCALRAGSGAWQAAAGAAAMLATFSKMNAVFFVPALALAVWLRPGEERPVRALAWLSAGGALVAAVFVLGFAIPHWQEFVLQNGRLAEEGSVGGIYLLTNVFALGLAPDAGGVRLGGFLSQALAPLALAGVWILQRALSVQREGLTSALRGLDSIERLALCWICAFLLYLATSFNAIDRRYYVFVVPLALLGAAVFQPRAVAPVHNGFGIPSRLAAAGLLLFAVLVYLRLPLMDLLSPTLARLPIGARSGLAMPSQAAVVVLLAGVLGVPLLLAALPRLARAGLPIGRVARGVLAGALCGSALQLWQELPLRTSMRDVGNVLASRFGPEARVFGGVANTLLMGRPVPTLFLLDRRSVGYPVFGASSLASFDPTHLVVLGPRTEPELGQRVRDVLGADYALSPGSASFFPLCSNERGEARFTVAAGTVQRAGR